MGSRYKVGDRVEILKDGAWCGCVEAGLSSLLAYDLTGGIAATITDVTPLGDYILEIPGGLLPHDIRHVMFDIIDVDRGDSFRLLEAGQQDNRTQVPIKSDGGSSRYYDIPLPKWLVDKICQRGEGGQAFIKTEELIEAGFGNDFDAGNIQKSLVRGWGAFNDSGKEGNSLGYEANKIRYSLDKLESRYGRNREKGQ